MDSKADCTWTVTFPTGRFSSAPVVQATPEKSGGRDYVVTITSRSATSVSGQVRSSRVVPQAVVNLLVTLPGGYDIFSCNAADLAKVHVLATQAVP